MDAVVKLISKIANIAASIPSFGSFYQPEEPERIKALLKKCNPVKLDKEELKRGK